MPLPVAYSSAFGAAALAVVLLSCGRKLRRACRVIVPWQRQGVPQRALFAQRLRTRDGSNLKMTDPGYCALVFWKAPARAGFDSRLVDLLTCCSGVYATGIDFSHHDQNESWLITSRLIRTKYWNLDGPHYMPASSAECSAWAKVRVDGYIDVPGLHADIEAMIADRSIRHRGLDPIGYCLGITRRNRVTCSGFIGAAILKQHESALAGALRSSLQQRFLHGEITPADLARAAAILGLVPEGANRPITVAPICQWPYSSSFSAPSSEQGKFHA
ncbi:MAG: hypothetical protein ABL967_05650 [Bryobacteraceae bacterium]